MENCANCHEAHGSSNPQLLKVACLGFAIPAMSLSRHPTQPQPLSFI